MVKKLMYIGVFAAIVIGAPFSNLAYAHFLVEDTRTGLKANFHITPDHDPIAGKESIISFDFAKTGFQAASSVYSLQVKSARGDAVVVPVDISGNVVIAVYTFPRQGFYDITLTATRKNDGTIATLQYGQRVSRGVVAEHHNGLGPLEMSVVIGVMVIAIGAVIGSVMSDGSKQRKAKKK